MYYFGDILIMMYNPTITTHKKRSCTTYSATCSGTTICDDYEEGYYTNTDTYIRFEKIKKDIEKIKMKNPLDKNRQKKIWKAIQEEHRRR
jgi:hypothetical protein